jgi:hypothetical protein
MQIYSVMIWLSSGSPARGDVYEEIEAENELDAVYQVMRRHGVWCAAEIMGETLPVSGRYCWLSGIYIPSLEK